MRGYVQGLGAECGNRVGGRHESDGSDAAVPEKVHRPAGLDGPRGSFHDVHDAILELFLRCLFSGVRRNSSLLVLVLFVVFIFLFPGTRLFILPFTLLSALLLLSRPERGLVESLGDVGRRVQIHRHHLQRALARLPQDRIRPRDRTQVRGIGIRVGSGRIGEVFLPLTRSLVILSHHDPRR